MTRIAINGLGRIGRTFLKLALEHPAMDVVAANDIADPNSLVYLLKYDSAYGRYTKSVATDAEDSRTWLRLGDHRLELLRERDPAALPWRALSSASLAKASAAGAGAGAAARRSRNDAAGSLSSAAVTSQASPRRFASSGAGLLQISAANISRACTMSPLSRRRRVARSSGQ